MCGCALVRECGENYCNRSYTVYTSGYRIANGLEATLHSVAFQTLNAQVWSEIIECRIKVRQRTATTSNNNCYIFCRITFSRSLYLCEVKTSGCIAQHLTFVTRRRNKLFNWCEIVFTVHVNIAGILST